MTSLQVNRKHYEKTLRELGLPKKNLHSRRDDMFDLAEKPTYAKDQERNKSSILSDDLPSLQRADGAQFFDESSKKPGESEDLPSDNDSWIIREESVTQEVTVVQEAPCKIVPTFELKASASIEK